MLLNHGQLVILGIFKSLIPVVHSRYCLALIQPLEVALAPVRLMTTTDIKKLGGLRIKEPVDEVMHGGILYEDSAIVSSRSISLVDRDGHTYRMDGPGELDRHLDR